MEPLRFDFDAPVVEAPPPFRGRTKRARHASWTGARHAVVTWGARASAYLQILAQGPKTDQEAAELLKKPLASINSVRHAIAFRFKRRGLVEPFVDCGFDVHAWGDGDTTTRTRWGLRATAAVLERELATHALLTHVKEAADATNDILDPVEPPVSDQGDGATSDAKDENDTAPATSGD